MSTTHPQKLEFFDNRLRAGAAILSGRLIRDEYSLMNKMNKRTEPTNNYTAITTI